jgi:ell wall binding domain 2 (CWB2)
MLSSIPSRRELLAWGLAIVLAVTAVTLARSDRAGAVVVGPTTQVVYIATGENFPDALGAAATAALGLGPVLLVQQNAVPAPTLAELNRLQPPDIVIVGGTAVISDAVKATLEALGWGPTVTRIAGANRYDTAAQLSLATFPTSGRYPLATYAGGEQNETVSNAAEVVRSVSLTAPVAGVIIVNSTANVNEPTAGDGVRCSITTGTDSVDLAFLQVWLSPGSPGDWSQMAGTRGFSVGAGQTLTVNLLCDHYGAGSASSDIQDSALTAIFVAGT